MPKIESEAGFTLIEMLAVMMIIALVAALAVTIWPGTGRARLKSVVMQAEALIRHERRAAILTAQDRGVSFDGNRRRLVGDDGDEVAVPHDVDLTILGSDAPGRFGRAVVLFHPDGASSGAALRFSREGAAYEIRVNWFSGRVAIEVP